ncbi:MAG TPA: glycosyltransferase family A protein [Ktedonosporobacter sp.]|jgi:glycosyltransferase involved in cell wall biosynthesis|nr:glycosyltransferase family A protein [Ktedonosporobacter sp.]
MGRRAAVDILLPTCNRLGSLMMTLSGVATQTLRDVRVIVADQSEPAVKDEQEIQTLRRVIEARGGSVEWHDRGPVYGIAEQRDFLLKRATAEAVLYLDDDVLMEPWVAERLLATLRDERCGFVGAFPAGLSHCDDVRPQQQQIEYWDGPVRPEVVTPGTPQWERWQLHRAANLYHVAQALPPDETRRYKVAWIASCILYDRAKLLAVGGFSFWSRLPRYHSGEEVLVQNLLLRRWGGCAIVPSGTYYSQAPTTVLNEAGTVDGHALDLLDEMVERYAPQSAITNVEVL